LVQLEGELSRLKHSLSLQGSKNEEYDKVAEFVKEFKIKQTNSESNEKRDIELLKGIVSEVQSKQENSDGEMKQLKKKVNQIESKISDDQHHIVKRQNSLTTKPMNRPNITTRIPCTPKIPCAFDFKDATSTSPSQKFDTVSSSNSLTLPSTCKDLSTKGHTSNGIYLLYDSNVKKVSTAFCDFNNNKGRLHFKINDLYQIKCIFYPDSGIIQLMLGFVDVKSLPDGVHFYAQRTKSFSENSNIPFDRVLVNEGGGLNGSTGIFRAPKPGIYRFWFNGLKDWDTPAVQILLRINGVCVGNAHATSGYGQALVATVHAVVKLNIGDEVTLFRAGDGVLFDDDTPDTHYSGSLVEEELTISQNP